MLADDLAAPEEPDDWEAIQRERHRQGAHTPLSSVGRVAAESDARRLVLTHFLPGDDALADEHWIRGVGGDFDGEVIPAQDLLEVEL